MEHEHRDRTRSLNSNNRKDSVALKSTIRVWENEHTFLQKGVTYEQYRLLNIFQVFTSIRGTFFQAIYQDKFIFIEQLLYILLCIGAKLVFVLLAVDINQTYITDKATVIGTLTTFALSLYLTMCVSRWWRLRADGIQKMWASNNNLAIRLNSIFVRLKDNRPCEYQKHLAVLHQFKKIKTHLQAAVSLVFHRYGQSGFSWVDLISRNILTATEQQKLRKQNGALSELMWSWVSNDLNSLANTNCFDDGDSKYWILNELMQLVYTGRGGSGLITAQLGCDLPFTYFHLVSFIVKINNITQCISAGSETETESTIYADITRIVLIILITMLFNTILIVGQRIQNPFTDNFGSFPGLKYETGFGLDFEVLLQFKIHEEEEKIQRLLKEQEKQQSTPSKINSKSGVGLDDNGVPIILKID